MAYVTSTTIHQICPYSKATGGNMPVKLTVV
jgi:organic hydroperoxide reductase OsmC/OhrA